MRRKVIYKPPGATTSEVSQSKEPYIPQSNLPPPILEDTSCLRTVAITSLTLLLVVALCCWLPFTLLKPDGQKVVDKIPIGSNLADLDKYADINDIGVVFVREWIPPTEGSEITEEQWLDRYESLDSEPLGDYESWTASAEERRSFTGVITSYSLGGLYAHSFQLDYYKGELRDKYFNTWID